MTCKSFHFVNGGAYLSIGGSSLSLTYGADGWTVSLGGRISIGPSVNGSTTLNWNNGEFTLGSQTGIGVGTPSGVPGISFSWTHDPASGLQTIQVGKGINDFLEAGGQFTANGVVQMSDGSCTETPNPDGPFPEDPWHGADPDAWGDAFDDAERTVSPIVLDLNGDGVKTAALTKGAWGGTHFNLDAQGKQHHQLGCLHPANTQPWRQTA